jgi:hypothetical protein
LEKPGKLTNNSIMGDNDSNNADMDVETVLSTFRENMDLGTSFQNNESNANMRNIQTLLDINP